MPLEILQTVRGSLYSLDRKLSVNAGLEKVDLIASDSWMETQLISATHSICHGPPSTSVILFILLGPSQKWDHKHVIGFEVDSRVDKKPSSSTPFCFSFNHLLHLLKNDDCNVKRQTQRVPQHTHGQSCTHTHTHTVWKRTSNFYWHKQSQSYYNSANFCKQFQSSFVVTFWFSWSCY